MLVDFCYYGIKICYSRLKKARYFFFHGAIGLCGPVPCLDLDLISATAYRYMAQLCHFLQVNNNLVQINLSKLSTRRVAEDLSNSTKMNCRWRKLFKTSTTSLSNIRRPPIFGAGFLNLKWCRRFSAGGSSRLASSSKNFFTSQNSTHSRGPAMNNRCFDGHPKKASNIEESSTCGLKKSKAIQIVTFCHLRRR